MARKKKTGSPQIAVGLVRTSTEEQKLSPTAQANELRQWAEKNGVTLVEIFEEQISGAAPLEKRMVLMAAIDSLRVHNAGWLVTLRRDRLSRSVMNATLIEVLVERAGAKVATTDGLSDGDGPEAELIRGVLDLVSQFEWSLGRSRSIASIKVKQNRGKYGELVGSVPYGYQVAEDGRTLEPDPAEQKTISIIKKLRKEGLTQVEVVERLNSTLEQTPPRGNRWHQKTISRIERRAAA